MRTVLKLGIPAAIAGLGIMLDSGPSFGKPEYVKQTKQKCAYCHSSAKPGKTDLSEAGKYFQEHKSMEGYQAK